MFPIIFFWDITYLLRGGRGSAGTWCQKRNPTNFIAISDHSKKNLRLAVFRCVWLYLVVLGCISSAKSPIWRKELWWGGGYLGFIVFYCICFYLVSFAFIWIYLVVFGCIWWYVVVFQVQIAPYEGKRCDEGWYLGLRGLRKFARFSPQVGHLYKWSNIPGSHCQFYQEVMITQLWIGPQERWGLVWLSRGKNLQFLCCVPTKEQTDRRRSYQAGILE